MDHNQQTAPQGELVFCHGCENEWNRSQHGLTCPECHSDFTEIIEANFDPRQQEQQDALGGGGRTAHGESDFNAPDPDEDDIDGVRWEQHAPGHFSVRGTVDRSFTPGAQGGGWGMSQGGFGGQGLRGLLGNLLQDLAAEPPQQQQQQQQQQRQYEGQQQVGSHRARSAPAPDWAQHPDRSSPYPGEQPQQQQQQRPNNGNSFVRSGGGPGFSWTIASSSNMNALGGPPGLFPRNPHGPQPFQSQPQQLEAILDMMMNNIGAARGGPGSPGGGDPRDDPFAHFFMGGGGSGGMDRGAGPSIFPLRNLMSIFGGGQMGDAVYSQEALDRIITQLMEQHQTGNAPGPASEAAIDSLPTKSISSKDLDEVTGKADCSICMEEVPLDTTVTVLPCSHWFHADCIKAWLVEHDTCPHCRQGIMPKRSSSHDAADDSALADGGSAATAAGTPRARARQPSQPPANDMRSPEYTRPYGSTHFSTDPPSSSNSHPPATAQDPCTVPDSPTMPLRRTSFGRSLDRRSSSGASGSGSGSGGGGTGSGSGTGMLNRMREAFGRSPSGGNNNGHGNSSPRRGSGGWRFGGDGDSGSAGGFGSSV